MNASEFDKLVENTRMKSRSIRLAREVLVFGKGYTEVAKTEVDAGRACSTQTVFRATKRVLREKLKLEGVSAEWECVVEAVPKALVTEIKRDIKKKVNDYKESLGLKLT